MTRLELRQKFRAENPEITSRVVTDSELNEWMKTANQEICCETRCIVTNATQTFNSTINVQFYDLESRITRFYDIDDMPGGGVYYNNLPLEKSSPAQMNLIKKSWKSSEAGTPKRYWRRGKYLWFDVKPSASNVTIGVDCILYPEDFDGDSEEPFDGLDHLQVYSDGINKYLQYRSKDKVGKDDEGLKAQKRYLDYVAWMKKRVSGAKFSSIYVRTR